MRNVKQAFWIVSAERANLSTELNLARTDELAGLLTSWGLEYERALGAYEGTEEECFIIPEQGDSDFHGSTEDRVLHALWTFNQDCALCVSDRQAYLFWSGSQQYEPIGRFFPVDRAVLEHVTGWTRIGDRYFTTG